jgi:hypothetical protein
MASSYGANALKSSGPSMSMVEGSVGIGNYKGVMLCNRPFGGTAGTVSACPRTEANFKVCILTLPFVIFSFLILAVSSKVGGGGGGGEKTTFNCGVVPETIGVNVPISAKEKVRSSTLD